MLKAVRKKARGRIDERDGGLSITFLTPTSLNEAFTEPLKFFVRKEFRRYKGSFSDEWGDGNFWHRGNTLDQKGMFKGISPDMRLETDYLVGDDNLIHSNTNFFPSEYSVAKQRRCQSVTLPKSYLNPIVQGFVDYIVLWNSLVALDKSKKKIEVTADASTFERKVIREYQQNRSKSKGPLRYKTLANLNSIPLVHDEIDLKSVIKEHIDLRNYVSGRIIKRSMKKFQVRFIYSESRVKEVNLENSTLNFCRDPRLKDVGMSISKQGLSIVTQDAFDDRKYYIIKPETLISKGFITNFFKNIYGKVRSIAIDSNCSVPKTLTEFRKKLIRQCRTMKAEGAAMFYEAPKLTSLGEQYPDNLPAHDPRHLKVWEKKAFRGVKEYAIIQGLTGEHMLVTPSLEGPLTVTGGAIPGLVMANHTLLQAVAKWDMWQGATFLSRASCRTVRKGLNRKREIHAAKALVL